MAPLLSSRSTKFFSVLPGACGAFLHVRPHRYERLCRSALDLVVLSPGFFEGTTKNSAIKTKPWRVANASPDSKILGGIPWEPGEEAGNTRIRQ